MILYSLLPLKQVTSGRTGTKGWEAAKAVLSRLSHQLRMPFFCEQEPSYCPETPSEVDKCEPPAIEKLPFGLPEVKPRLQPCSGCVSQAFLIKKHSLAVQMSALHAPSPVLRAAGCWALSLADSGRDTAAAST